MPYNADSETRSRVTGGMPDSLDRILLAVCAVVWLAALGAGVAAVVTLVDLGDKHSSVGHGTTWQLYAVIGVSAAVIIGAIPLLLRARRASSKPSAQIFGADTAAPDSTEAPPAPVGRNVEPGFGEAETTKLRSFNDPAVRSYAASPATGMVGFPVAAVDQLWLRATAGIATVLGVAMLFSFLGTYMMADAHDALSWTLYGLAGLFTVGLLVVPWYCLRELRAVLASSAQSSHAA
ncbi:hypothetical protein ABIA30_004897 [Mycobacterium sp. MAA66]|jgi:hypothetical protein|uniref:DUF2561 family protein n=1 Tax=Mycobacterium sp. MAA66 TaxID=3156297 RepID=UPI0035157C4C